MFEEKTPLVKSEIQHQELDDGAVLFDPTTDRVHTLNASAAYVWNSCDGTRSLEEISRDLANVAGISVEKARSDVEAAMDQFQREKLLSE